MVSVYILTLSGLCVPLKSVIYNDEFGKCIACINPEFPEGQYSDGSYYKSTGNGGIGFSLFKDKHKQKDDYKKMNGRLLEMNAWR